MKTGRASGTSSTATVSWTSGASITIGTIHYELFADRLALLPPASGLRRWRQQKA